MDQLTVVRSLTLIWMVPVINKKSFFAHKLLGDHCASPHTQHQASVHSCILPSLLMRVQSLLVVATEAQQGGL